MQTKRCLWFTWFSQFDKMMKARGYTTLVRWIDEVAGSIEVVDLSSRVVISVNFQLFEPESTDYRYLYTCFAGILPITVAYETPEQFLDYICEDLSNARGITGYAQMIRGTIII